MLSVKVSYSIKAKPKDIILEMRDLARKLDIKVTTVIHDIYIEVQPSTNVGEAYRKFKHEQAKLSER